MADTHPAGQLARLSVTQTDVDGIRLLAVAGELDADNADALREALRVEENSTPPLTVLDFGAVTFMDSSALTSWPPPAATPTPQAAGSAWRPSPHR